MLYIFFYSPSKSCFNLHKEIKHLILFQKHTSFQYLANTYLFLKEYRLVPNIFSIINGIISHRVKFQFSGMWKNIPIWIWDIQFISKGLCNPNKLICRNWCNWMFPFIIEPILTNWPYVPNSSIANLRNLNNW